MIQTGTTRHPRRAVLQLKSMDAGNFACCVQGCSTVKNACAAPTFTANHRGDVSATHAECQSKPPLHFPSATTFVLFASSVPTRPPCPAHVPTSLAPRTTSNPATSQRRCTATNAAPLSVTRPPVPPFHGCTSTRWWAAAVGTKRIRKAALLKGAFKL